VRNNLRLSFLLFKFRLFSRILFGVLCGFFFFNSVASGGEEISVLKIKSVSMVTSDQGLSQSSLSKNDEKRNQCVNLHNQDLRLGDLVLLEYPNQSVLSQIVMMKISSQDFSKLWLHHDEITQEDFTDFISQNLRELSLLDLKNTRVVFEIPEKLKFQKCNYINELYLYNLASIAVLGKCSQCRIESLSRIESMRFEERPKSARLVGKDYSQISFLDGNQKPLDQTPLDVMINVPLWVTKVPMKKGDIISHDKVQESVKTINLGKLNYIPQGNFEFDHYQLQWSLGSDHIVRIQDLKKVELVKTGQIVKGSIRGQFFEIQSSFVVKRSGSRDETVIVENPETKKNFSARVISSQEVEILD
jgi:flagella basal body P-ring formation protein FlgA